MQNSFNIASLEGLSTRDRAAAEYIASPGFLAACREALRRDLISSGDDHAVLSNVEIRLKRQDEPYLQQVFPLLKKEFPELDNMRVDWNTRGVLMDTKRPSALRSVKRAFSF